MLLIVALVVSAYFAFFHAPKKVKLQLLDDDANKSVGAKLNDLVASAPNPLLESIITDLNWLLRNDYKRDIRVKRIIHQDLVNLVAISDLWQKLEYRATLDSPTKTQYIETLACIADRTRQLRYSKDEHIRDEILLLGDLIKRNDQK